MAKGFGGSPFGKNKAPPFGAKGGAKPNPFAKKGAAPADTAPPPDSSFAMKKGGRVKKNKGGKAC
jgi:hypothetical protein